MPMNDTFAPDAFKLNTLTAAINTLPYLPQQLSAKGWWNEGSINTLHASIEMRDGVLQLVDVAARGGVGQTIDEEDRNIYSFAVPHLPQRDTILADEVQGVRAFGTESQSELLTTRLNDKLSIMKRNIDYTMESHRVQNVLGNFVDVNGQVKSLYSLFGVTQTTIVSDLTVPATEIRQFALDLTEAVESALDGVSFTGITLLCSPTYWRKLIVHPTVKETYLNQQQASQLRGDVTQSFEIAEGVMAERYRGTGDVKIPNGEAVAVPTGVPDLFLTRFAPADYIDVVNTMGLPYYANSGPLQMRKGYMIESQSNPVNLTTRPAALIKVTSP